MARRTKMVTLRSPEEMTAWSRQSVRRGRPVGFVPTMGALHEGHLSLVRRSNEDGHRTVASVFVNPTQFGPGEDFKAYPRDLGRDAAMLAGAGCQALFAPEADALYPAGFATYVVPDGGPAAPLEGTFRPTHFRGVATVVLKLFEIVRPAAAYFGQKDYQQTLVVRRMTKDLDLGVRIVVCPTFREADGLAMSSRNAYLSPAERDDATCLHRAIEAAALRVEAGERDANVLRGVMRKVIGAVEIARPDYVEVADPATLLPLDRIDDERGAIALLAVRVGKTRLIDNAFLVEPAREVI